MANKHKPNERKNSKEELRQEEIEKEPVVIKEKENSVFSNIVAALLALLFVGVAGYYIYSYFGDSINLNLKELFTFDRQSREERFEFETKPDPVISDGEILTNKDVRDDDNNTGQSSTSNVAGDNSESVFAQWIANDYVEGDIEKGDYTVREGDTLWELAEGAYGDAYQWETILNQNINDIGFLPNGQQALIFPNQVLRI